MSVAEADQQDDDAEFVWTDAHQAEFEHAQLGMISRTAAEIRAALLHGDMRFPDAGAVWLECWILAKEVEGLSDRETVKIWRLLTNPRGVKSVRGLLEPLDSFLGRMTARVARRDQQRALMNRAPVAEADIPF